VRDLLATTVAVAALAAATATGATTGAPHHVAPAATPRAATAAAAHPPTDEAIRLLTDGDAAGAERGLRGLIANGTGGATAHGLLAVALARQDKDKDAEQELADGLASGAEATAKVRAAAVRVQSVRTLMLLARIQAGNHDGAGALSTLANARELAPSSEDVLSAHAQLALATHQPQYALADLDDLTRMHPTVSQYHYLLGVALLQEGDAQGSTDELLQADKLEPDQTLTMTALGLAMNASKLYDQAKPYLERSLEREPENVDVLAALAESEEGSGQVPQAETHARQALAKSPENGDANLVLGIVLMRQEKYAEARAVLEKAVAANASSAKAHYQLSLACARLGDNETAQKEQQLYTAARRAYDKRAEEQLAERARANRPGGRGGMGQ
jgi:tetratricopeptide (TPR) repeat protein